jgi:cytolysin-activating lysine-acyltransferase
MNITEAASPTDNNDANAPSNDDLQTLARLAREQSARLLRKLPVLGPVTWLLMSNPMTRHTLLSECEWRLLPALVLDQIKLYLQDEKPVAFVTWARLSDSVAERYRLAPHHLSGSDWSSGDQVWIVDVVTPFGGAQDVLKDLRQNVFPGQAIYQLLPTGNGAAPAKTLTWPPLQAN